MVAVLVEDPELGVELSATEREHAMRTALARVVPVQPGPMNLGLDETEAASHLGLLVLDGMIVRHVGLAQIGSSEMLGPGDLLRPWRPFGGQRWAGLTRWEALTPARIALLDRDFAYRIRAWPEITTALLDRARDRVDFQLLQSAIRQARRVEDRVALALWYFAERWGETTPDGIVSPAGKVTGDVLAQMVGARRQSVSMALGALLDRGVIRRRADGRLILPPDPPFLNALQTEEPPADQPDRRRRADRRAGPG
jgi:CRP/FNR family cyclic AMP-dependent transcriptional regulator